MSPPGEHPVTTRLVDPDHEPFPYTKIRDWIALLGQDDLGDGAFRLYIISRSVIWENAKAGPPPRPVIEISYEEYAKILGRSARTISRFADELYRIGLWEEVERASRSVRIPGKPRPQVQTVLTIRVHDYPREPWAFDGPVKTWDVLAALREERKNADGKPAGPTGRTDLSAQSDQAKPAASSADRTPGRTPAAGPADVPAGPTATTDLSAQSDQATSGTESTPPAPSPSSITGDADVPAGPTATTDLSTQSDQAKPVADTEPAADEPETTAAAPPSPAETPPPPGACDRTNLSEPRTNLSGDDGKTAGHNTCETALKKKEQKEQPSLPPAPSTGRGTPLADELAMFSTDAIDLVTELYNRALTLPNAQVPSAADRTGLARRIDTRLAEGWSLARISAVLRGGTLDGVRMPGRFWIRRLDEMPTFPRAATIPAQRTAPQERPRTAAAAPTRPARTKSSTHTVNDCSGLPDPNPGQARYEIPDARGRVMTGVYADERTIKPWCGRCSDRSRTLRPHEPGGLPRPCGDCHPNPAAFPADTGLTPATTL